jgi:hypothetical protein
MCLTSYSTYYELYVLKRITKMNGRFEEQLPLAFASIVVKLEVLHQNLEFPKNRVLNIVSAY